jgi:hypothetical protein
MLLKYWVLVVGHFILILSWDSLVRMPVTKLKCVKRHLQSHVCHEVAFHNWRRLFTHHEASLSHVYHRSPGYGMVFQKVISWKCATLTMHDRLTFVLLKSLCFYCILFVYVLIEIISFWAGFNATIPLLNSYIVAW